MHYSLAIYNMKEFVLLGRRSPKMYFSSSYHPSIGAQLAGTKADEASIYDSRSEADSGHFSPILRRLG